MNVTTLCCASCSLNSPFISKNGNLKDIKSLGISSLNIYACCMNSLCLDFMYHYLFNFSLLTFPIFITCNHFHNGLNNLLIVGTLLIITSLIYSLDGCYIDSLDLILFSTTSLYFKWPSSNFKVCNH